MCRNQSLITILTPTYNRANRLQKLYESLKSQTEKEFNWLIVDDGSTDYTENLVKGWQQKKELEIR